MWGGMAEGGVDQAKSVTVVCFCLWKHAAQRCDQKRVAFHVIKYESSRNMFCHAIFHPRAAGPGPAARFPKEHAPGSASHVSGNQACTRFSQTGER